MVQIEMEKQLKIKSKCGRYACNTSDNISLTSVINLIFMLLLLLMFYADVCKSNEYPLTSDVTSAVNVKIDKGNDDAQVNINDAQVNFDDADSDVNVNANANVNNGDSDSTAAGDLFLLGINASAKFDSVSGARINQRHLNITNVAYENTTNYDLLIKNVTHECLERCFMEANSFLNEYGVDCQESINNTLCFGVRCQKGCELWWKVLNNSESCHESCFSTQFFAAVDLPCVSACEYGQRRYWHLQKTTLATQTQFMQPHIFHDNSTNQLSIQWKIQLPDNYFANHQFFIQYQYVTNNKTNSQHLHWKNFASYGCNQIFECEIFDELMPYTTYKLRLKLHFGDDYEQILYSRPTELFTTASNGVPTSEPILKSVNALDHSHISAFWAPGQFCNGPITGYKLILEQTNYTFQEILQPNIHNYIFHNLVPFTNYTFKLAMLNTAGEGPVAVTTVLTKKENLYNDSLDAEQILVAGEYSIKLKSLDRLFETKVLLESEELISDYALCASDERLFVVDVSGNINSISLQENAQKDTLHLDGQFMDFKPKKISVDWLNKQLFLAGERHSKTWTIIKTNFNGDSATSLAENLTTPIERLDVDPINGWLFWRQKDGLLRMDLSSRHIEYTLKYTDIGHFLNVYESTLLIFYDKTSKELYELSYDGSYREKLKQKLPETFAGDIQSFQYLGVNFLATNGTHIISQNLHSNVYNIWAVKEVEWCWSFFPLLTVKKYTTQPQAIEYRVPTNLHALLTSNTAKITWDAPSHKAFQSAYAWQDWEYELEIMDVASNSAFTIRNIKTKYFNVEKLQPNNLYKFRVRIVSQNGGVSAATGAGVGGAAGTAVGGGEWSNTLLTRTWPLGEYKFLVASANGIHEIDELGEHLAQIAAMQDVQEFVQLNGTIYYIAKDKRVRCANIMNPEINCSFTATNAVSLTYDWRGGKLYWIDTLSNSVLRANLDGGRRELLPIFGARIIKVDTDSGYIYYTNGLRLVKGTMGYAIGMNDLEYYHVNTYDDVIRDFTFDTVGRRIFWIVRQHDGQMQLFQAALDNNTESNSNDGVSMEEDIVVGTLQYLHEIDSLTWIQFNSSKIVLVRTSNLNNKAYIDLPQLDKLSCAYLRTEYTPFMDLSIIPEAVDSNNLQFNDDYLHDLNIKWNPLTAAENDTVFYNVLVQYNATDGQSQTYAAATNQTALHIENLYQLQQPYHITITPYTNWIMGPTTVMQFRSASITPAIPQHLRVYVEYFADPLEMLQNISALVRWDPPENISTNTTTYYKVQCWYDGNIYEEIIYNSSDKPYLETNINGLQIGETYTFQVQALDVNRLNGGQKATLKLQIDPDTQTRPNFFYATNEFIATYDLDHDMHTRLVNTTNEVEHFTMINGEQRLLWVNENVELISFVHGTKPTKLARMRAEVLALTVDWIQRIVYWAEMDTDDELTVCIYKLDLCKFNGRIMSPEKLIALEKRKILQDLTVLPHENLLIWLAANDNDKQANTNTTLMGYDLSNATLLKFTKGAYFKLYAVSLANAAATVNLIDINGINCVYDLKQRNCNTQQMTLINDTAAINAIESDSSHVYVRKNDNVFAYSKPQQKLLYERKIENLKNIKAHSFQNLPTRDCLLPQEQLYSAYPALLNPQTSKVAENFIILRFPLVHLIQNCTTNIPGLSYVLTISDNANLTRNYSCYDSIFEITDLQPFTNYDIQLTISSYYQKKLKEPFSYSELITVRTDIGTPTIPENFLGYALSPTQIKLSWSAPLHMNSEHVWYQLHWQMQDSALGAHKRLNATTFIIPNLAPAQQYTLWLQVFSTDTKFNATTPIKVTTYPEPKKLSLRERKAYNLTLNWLQPTSINRSVLVCHEVNGNNQFSIDVPMNANTTKIVVPNLAPKTKYEFYLELTYNVDMDTPYIWPELPNEWFVYETIGDTPGRPGQPQIEHITNQIFKVYWEPAKSNGEPIATYSLEGLQAHTNRRIKRANVSIRRRIKREKTASASSSEPFEMLTNLTNFSQRLWVEEPKPMEDKWIVICNTTQLSCIVRDLHTQRLLMFRVRARNSIYGWGAFSPYSERIAEPFVSYEKRESLVLAIILPATIVSSCVLILIIIRTIYTRRLKARKLLEKSRPSIWSNFSTIQQQFMATQNRAFSLTSNSTLYTGGPLSDADIALLPHINWNQLTLLNFLGSGAFGEVYEGLITYDGDGEQERVAIKSLRKGASEFAELLQEAQLMSNFKHENIVRLIGVCFDTESVSIIMEHMEGGDLLTYLRESRPNSNKQFASLKLLDLIGMCVDVAKGCCYLENMHFVHRDLACRNCLVSSRDPIKRTVKIGDFGLARDIYKNDYYRKEGEGLLPVRWMAPECLIDGIFTTQSDVWAFAVLCWEILTLGQQPYAARNNYEVLNYVKDDGRLDQPQNCPDKLFALMTDCWNNQADERPTFRHCFATLLSIKTDVRRFSMACNGENSDHILYANSLPTIKEQNVCTNSAYSGNTLNNEQYFKNTFETFCRDVDIETVSDDSQLIGSELSSIKAAPTCYVNEGVSRF